MSAKILDRTNSHLRLRLQSMHKKNGETGARDKGVICTKSLLNGGITNRNGLSNGLVNGNGLINGVSLRGGVRKKDRIMKILQTSGLKGFKPTIIETLRDISMMLKKGISRRTAMSVMIALLFVLPAGYLSLPSASNHSGIIIDGSISDWDGAPRQSLFGTHGSLVESAMKTDGDTLYFYLRSTPVENTKVFYGLIDSDGNPNTGYQYGGIGADYLISIKLSSQGVLSKTASIYGSSKDTGNWSYWTAIGNVVAASGPSSPGNDSLIEVKVPSYLFGNELSDNFRVIWQDGSLLFPHQ